MLLIQNAKVITMENKDYLDGGQILMDNGRIVAVGYDLPQKGARVVDAHGCYALPGVIDAHCHVGMWEDGMGFEGSDGNEMTDPITPQLRAIDGINPQDRCFDEALAAGVTTVAVGPGSANVIGGQCALLKTGLGPLDARILAEPLALKVAFGENPKRVYTEKKRNPTTRMAIAALLRQALIDAQEYGKKIDAADAGKRPARDLGKEVLLSALRGELMVKAHAHRADDILTALRVAREFGLRLSLEHCTEGYMIADQLREAQNAANLPIIIGPLLSERSKIELRNLTFEAPAKLHAAGVRFAMMTDHPVIPLQYLTVCAAIAAREGLPEREALRCITIDAAWAVGYEAELGSLAPGKAADLALYDAHPLDTRAHVKEVYLGGERVK
ncbi:MAG: amidohydrolase [Clostridia bacterium]|nr:amidohydrolase [Clostridia bacterium]